MALDLEEMSEKLRVSLANETKESLTTWLNEQREKEALSAFDAAYAEFTNGVSFRVSFRDELIALPYKKIKLRLPRKVKKWIKKNNYYKIDVFDRELMVAFCKPKYL